MARPADIVIDCHDPIDDPTVLVESKVAARQLWFQQVPEPKSVKTRVHVDLRADHVDAEIERLVSLGATLAAEQPDPAWTVLLDPEGNEFCLLP